MSWLRTAIAAALVLALPAPAHAGVVANVGLGHTLDDLIVGTDGGAWVLIDGEGDKAVGHADAGGGFRTTRNPLPTFESTLGPDGAAWFRVSGIGFARADANGAVSEIRPNRDERALGEVFASGPDGTLWMPTRERDGFWHVAPDGTVSRTAARLTVPCAPEADFSELTRASDDAMWLNDSECHRLIRVSPSGTTAVFLTIDPFGLAADRAGGVWVQQPGIPATAAHVGSDQHVATFELPRAIDTGSFSVAPDGSAWFTADDCRLLRLTATGEVTTTPTPIQVREVAFDPAGGLWLMGLARLVHLAPGEPVAPCDRRPPSARIERLRDGGSVSLRRLRRRGGFTISVREPAAVDIAVDYYDSVRGPGTSSKPLSRIVRRPNGGAVRYRIPAARLRRFQRDLTAGRKPNMFLRVGASDADGNERVLTARVRITR